MTSFFPTLQPLHSLRQPRNHQQSVLWIELCWLFICPSLESSRQHIHVHHRNGKCIVLKTTRVWLTSQVFLRTSVHSYVFSPFSLNLRIIHPVIFEQRKRRITTTAETTNLLFINLAFIFIFNLQSIVEWLRWSWHVFIIFLLSFPDGFFYICFTIYLLCEHMSRYLTLVIAYIRRELYEEGEEKGTGKNMKKKTFTI